MAVEMATITQKTQSKKTYTLNPVLKLMPFNVLDTNGQNFGKIQGELEILIQGGKFDFKVISDS